LKSEYICTRYIIGTLLLSVCLAVTYISALFLGEVVSYKCGSPETFMYIGMMAIIYLLMLISKDRKNVVIKWILSIPFAIPVWYWFVKSEYSLRALNWAIPGYGRQSGGGAFAVVFLWAAFTGMCIVALFVCVAGKLKFSEKILKMQPFISLAVTLFVIAAVFILERKFPSAEEVKAWIYS